MTSNPEPTETPSAMASNNPQSTTVEAADSPTTELPHRLKPASPHQGATETPPPSNVDDDGDDEGAAVKPNEELVNLLKKKKKKRSKGVKAKNKPTGFEDYYVDPPITPEEYAQERKLYDTSIPAVNRLELAIQRYQAKRRIHSERKTIFTKYMAYGGVDVGPKMFQGVDQRDIEDMDDEDIVAATAQSTIPKDRSEWTVDFELVAKGFFSSILLEYFAPDNKDFIDVATKTIKNFLNYILYHDVVPEYESSIFAARNVCDLASKELWLTCQASSGAPGDFNMACSTLFGDEWSGMYSGDQEWAKEETEMVGMPGDTARKVVKSAIAGAGTLEQADRFRGLANENKLEAKCVEENGFEVISIIPATNDVKVFYREYAKDLKPVGKIRARPWRNPGDGEEDFPPGEVSSYLKNHGMEYEFFIEERYLDCFFEGMKFEAKIWELNCGIYFFEKVLAIFCSFYTVLPNESMLGWKKPRDLKDDELAFAEGANGRNKEADANGEVVGESEGEDNQATD